MPWHELGKLSCLAKPLVDLQFLSFVCNCIVSMATRFYYFSHNIDKFEVCFNLGQRSFCQICRVEEKREYQMIMLDSFSTIYLNLYVVTPHLDCLYETVQKRANNICLKVNG